MRTELSLNNILGVYRGTAILIGSIAAAIGLLLLIAMVDHAHGGEHLLLTLAGGLICGMGLLVAVVTGYFSLRRALLVAERRRKEMLASLNRDALTGAYTRKFFLERLRDLVRQAPTSPVAYLQFDVDHLKAINDGNGHAAGDKALVRLVEVVSDILPGALLGRLGGDEFAVAIPGVSSKAVVRKMGHRILEELDRPQNVAGREMRLSATMGLSIAPEDAGDVDTLMSKADLALYKGKSLGRNTVVCFEKELLTEERHQRFIERELRAAILMDELELHYQPVFRADGSLRCYEALVRWRHSVRGMIPPDRFISIAEQSDLIVKLGQWVLRRACIDFPHLDATVVAINVSAAELRDPAFAARAAQIMAECAMDGRNLIVEITETAPLHKNSVEQRNLEHLRALGIRVAVDDFGAGHASLGYLRELSFDVIKIDRSYIERIDVNTVDQLIVASICRIAQELDVAVIAEGIETQAQYDLLKTLGCTGFQGFLLGRPAALPRPIPGDASAAA